MPKNRKARIRNRKRTGFSLSKFPSLYHYLAGHRVAGEYWVSTRTDQPDLPPRESTSMTHPNSHSGFAVFVARSGSTPKLP